MLLRLLLEPEVLHVDQVRCGGHSGNAKKDRRKGKDRAQPLVSSPIAVFVDSARHFDILFRSHSCVRAPHDRNAAPGFRMAVS
jgi:hypothetical protein